MGKSHCFRGFIPGARVRRTNIQRHADVDPQLTLDLNRSFRREEVLRTVEVRFERNALFGDLAHVGKAHHLIAAGVGQDRALPRHKFVESAKPLDKIGAWSQGQVVCV
jgi:hypothetical protein